MDKYLDVSGRPLLSMEMRSKWMYSSEYLLFSDRITYVTQT